MKPPSVPVWAGDILEFGEILSFWSRVPKKKFKKPMREKFSTSECIVWARLRQHYWPG